MLTINTHLGLFEGIGGFSLAARWMGWKTLAWCEWNEFGQKVLKHHFPEAEGFGDITKTDFTKYANRIDILTGGFPCQPYSLAGKRKGKEDERHLWPEMLRAIREVQPRWVVGENVSGLINWNGGLVFNEVQSDLEAEGYEVQPFVLPACGVNAPHKRDRIWFVANSESKGSTGLSIRKESTHPINGIIGNYGIVANTIGSRWIQDNKQQPSRKSKYVGPSWEQFPTQSPICTRNDGFSSKLDGITFPKWRSESIKAAGNAIVPQVAYQIFKSLEAIDSNFQ
jgi:DNA (cytosine-5)-methyltransferase 1